MKVKEGCMKVISDVRTHDQRTKYPIADALIDTVGALLDYSKASGRGIGDVMNAYRDGTIAIARLPGEVVVIEDVLEG